MKSFTLAHCRLVLGNIGSGFWKFGTYSRLLLVLVHGSVRGAKVRVNNARRSPHSY